MTTLFAEPGTDATFGIEFYPGIIGSVVSDNSQSKTGPRSVKHDTEGGNISLAALWGLLADAGRRVSFYVRFTHFPQGVTGFWNNHAAGGEVVQLRITSGGVLQLWEGVANQIGSNGSTLSLNTWYRVCVAYKITSSTVNEFRVYLDGTLDISASDVTLTYTGGVDNHTGWLASASLGSDKVLNIDDLYIDDSDSLEDTGDIRVTAKLPGAVNNNNFDTSIGSGDVNERAVSETNGKRHNASGDVAQDYGLEAASAGDEDIDGRALVAQVAWVWAKRGAGAAGNPDIINNGNLAGITLTETSALYKSIVDSTTYPSASDAIGMRSPGADADTFFYEGGMIIAYKGRRRVLVT